MSADLLESICDAVQSGKVRRSESRIAPGIVDAGGVIEADPEPVYLFSQEGRGLVQDLIDRQSGHVPGKLEKAYVPWL